VTACQLRRWVCVAAALLGVVVCSAHVGAQARSIAIQGARLIDGTGAPPIDDAVILVEGDRIRSAGPAARVRVPPDAIIVDAHGQVVLPGLVDVHCHINQPPEDMKKYWLAQLRWGVTTMRSAGND
jgi:imidazolonepropionase-like amidohydrolase